MDGRKPTFVLAAIAGVIGAAVAGCNAILGGGYTATAEDGGEPAFDAALSAEAGRGDSSRPGAPDACAAVPESKPQFESACTNAACVPFDNAARNRGCDAGDGVPGADPDRHPRRRLGRHGSRGRGERHGTGRCGRRSPSRRCFGRRRAAAAPGVLDPDVRAGRRGAPGDVHLRHGLDGDAALRRARRAGAREPQHRDRHLPRGGLVPRRRCDVGGVSARDERKDGELLRPESELGGSGSGRHVHGRPSSQGPRSRDLGCVSDDVRPAARHLRPPEQRPRFLGARSGHGDGGPSHLLQTSISADAAYMVWGFGADSGVAPWTDPSFLLQRSATSGTENMIGAAIGLPPSTYAWSGGKNAGSANVVAAITNVTKGLLVDGGAPASKLTQANVDSTLGILASDVADGNRQVLKPLAFQDVGGSCGWFPDSTQTSFDKKNVRDGHYPIWGPSHFLAYVDANGNPLSASVKALDRRPEWGERPGAREPRRRAVLRDEPHRPDLRDARVPGERRPGVRASTLRRPRAAVTTISPRRARSTPAQCVSCKASSDCAGRARRGDRVRPRLRDSSRGLL